MVSPGPGTLPLMYTVHGRLSNSIACWCLAIMTPGRCDLPVAPLADGNVSSCTHPPLAADMHAAAGVCPYAPHQPARLAVYGERRHSLPQPGAQLHGHHGCGLLLRHVVPQFTAWVTCLLRLAPDSQTAPMCSTSVAVASSTRQLQPCPGAGDWQAAPLLSVRLSSMHLLSEESSRNIPGVAEQLDGMMVLLCRFPAGRPTPPSVCLGRLLPA
jgi:hypothetical protein